MKQVVFPFRSFLTGLNGGASD